jgi:Bardet-Biedl syndrome 9 protein
VSRVCCTKFNIHVIVASTLFSSQRQECQNSNIAILHPRKLVIYSLVTSTGFAEHGNVYMSLHGTVDLTLFPEKINDIEFFAQTFMYASGQQSKLQILQQHELQKFAFTMCKGNFGGVKGKEFICVMFLDNSLKFFEQDGISQDCILPGNRTIPTKFIYVPRTDCFILLAPNWDLECYRLVDHQREML